jgi:DNA-binding response OmpR family regulator
MRRVLVVDDDASIRRLVRIILADAGFVVFEAEDGEQALEILERESPEVLLLDLNMPVMDGRELFERLRQHGRRPRTVIISAGPSERTRQELGAEASLQKPFGPDDLVETVCALSNAA